MIHNFIFVRPPTWNYDFVLLKKYCANNRLNLNEINATIHHKIVSRIEPILGCFVAEDYSDMNFSGDGDEESTESED